MASTKYPLATLSVPDWLTREQIDQLPQQIFFNWRLNQRIKPEGAEEIRWDSLARIGYEIAYFVDRPFYDYLYYTSAKDSVRMMVVHQGYGGDQIITSVADTSVWFLRGGSLPRLDRNFKTMPEDDFVWSTIWSPLVLCVAPLRANAPEFAEAERPTDPTFLRLLKEYGIPKRAKK